MLKKTSTRFLYAYLLTLVFLLFGVAAFNAVVDPFGVYRLIEIKGFNDVKAGQGSQARMAKAGAVRVFKPKAVILGDSRAEYGINPEHLAWKTRPVYNLGISGANAYEIMRYFQHAHGIQPLQQVVYILDFKQFNAYRKNESDFSEDRLSVTRDGRKNRFSALADFISTTLSIKALSQSVNTIWRSAARKTTTYLANGQRDWHDDLLFRTAIERYGSYSRLFSEEERSLFAERSRGRVPPYRESFVDPESGVNTLESFRQIVRTAIRDKIDLRLVIGPSHARYFECYRLMGDWYLWEEWKRALVRVLEEEAEKAGVTPFPLWDFSGFNDYTMEPVPRAGDKKTRMKWYFEASHYTTDLGDLVQDRVFDHKEPGRTVPGHFGVLLTSRNIESHLRKLREENKRFREAQPPVARELSDMAAHFDLLDDYARDMFGSNVTVTW